MSATESRTTEILSKLQTRLEKLPQKELEEITQKMVAVPLDGEIHIDNGGTHIHVK